MMDASDLAGLIRRRFREGDARLPVLPEAVIEVRRIVGDERKGAADIARVIGGDPTLSSSVLRVANSARFRASGAEIRSLPVAIQRLGGRRTLELLVAISSRLHMAVRERALQAMIRECNDYCLRVAIAAQHLARLSRAADPGEAFLAGLLFEIGVPAIISAAEKELASCSEADRLGVVRALHREMGGRLLTLWEMPDIFAAVATHHGIEADDRPHEALIDLVDAACLLLVSLGRPSPFDEPPETTSLANAACARRLNITETHLAAVEVELEDACGELGAALGG